MINFLSRHLEDFPDLWISTTLQERPTRFLNNILRNFIHILFDWRDVLTKHGYQGLFNLKFFVNVFHRIPPEVFLGISPGVTFWVPSIMILFGVPQEFSSEIIPWVPSGIFKEFHQIFFSGMSPEVHSGIYSGIHFGSLSRILPKFQHGFLQNFFNNSMWDLSRNFFHNSFSSSSQESSKNSFRETSRNLLRDVFGNFFLDTCGNSFRDFLKSLFEDTCKDIYRESYRNILWDSFGNFIRDSFNVLNVFRNFFWIPYRTHKIPPQFTLEYS